MRIYKSLNGLYPRGEKLIKVTRDYDRGRVDETQLVEAYEADMQALFKLQEGLDLQYDGLLNWQDLLRPFVEIWDAVRMDGLVRYYETNTFFRVIEFGDNVRLDEPQIEPWFDKYFHKPHGGLWFAYLPAPTLVRRFAKGATLRVIVDIMLETAHYIIPKVDAIYFGDPSLVYDGVSADDMQVLRKFYAMVKRELGSKLLLLMTYFASPDEERLNFLVSLEVDAIGLDFVHTEYEVLKRLHWPHDKGIAAGVFDTENSLIESPNTVIQFVQMLAEELNPQFIIITGSSDWHFLPRTCADKKVQVLKSLPKTI